MAAVGIDLRFFVSQRSGSAWSKFISLVLLFSIGIWALPAGMYWAIFRKVEITILVYQMVVVTSALAYFNALLFRFLSKNITDNFSRSILYRQLSIFIGAMGCLSFGVNYLLGLTLDLTLTLVFANMILGMLISLFYVSIELRIYRLIGFIAVILLMLLGLIFVYPLKSLIGLGVLYFCCLILMVSIPKESDFDQRSFFQDSMFISLASLFFMLGFWSDKVVLMNNLSVYGETGSIIIKDLTLAFFLTLPVNLLAFLITEYYWGYSFFKLMRALRSLGADIDSTEREFIAALKRILCFSIMIFAILAVVYILLVPPEATLVVLSLTSQFFAQVFFVFLIYFRRDFTLLLMSSGYLCVTFFLANSLDLDRYFGLSLLIANLFFAGFSMVLLKFDIDKALVRYFQDA